ncbi:dienelactone hydrolase family protein [Paenibacillus sp. HN-1]|uniref:alpha/beta hydrolase n=1 Tax=Paenibacillus TaxID=44249 RepID=UPI001CAA1B52|nr:MULTISPECIES: dienelactone hydrolase family protein [Paenibacillus]MBY9080607.1 dienelactone hydrolase family protein [Paenibacillus sp. CGMCC 1.18879]MBY9085448.1 dienelactone hydrolase family protein [Paenibacillus sinensis]
MKDYPYTVVLPDNYNEDSRYPAVFALHGKGSNERDLLELLKPLGTKFILFGIRGDREMGPGFQYYELKSLGNPVREQFDEAAAGLEAFIEEASAQYAVDPARRYVVGFSQGAILASSLALTMGDRLKGIAALNGYVPDFVKNEYPVRSVEKLSIFISHGEFDPVFPVRIGYETADFFKSRNDQVIFRIYPSGHTVTGENQAEVLRFLEQDAFSDSHTNFNEE